ncbi:MAG: FAD-binding oxidoreductase, partial [Acidobacteria bacterium]|nr:FAD-binding oxidoreductase [Acidobacteriota bacterium]
EAHPKIRNATSKWKCGMMTADVVVIGAGVNGASTAYNLAKRGVKKVVLLEKYLIASGGTGRSAAIVRQHYSSEPLIRMVKRSVEIFSNFNEIIGGSAGFVNCGYGFLAPENVSEGFSRNLALQQKLGIDTREISKDDFLKLEPRADLSDVDRICYEPGSGYADPHDTTYSYVKRFQELGGELMQMTPVIGLVRSNGAVKGVRTAKGDLSSGTVINAAGPWAAHVARWAGLEVPIQVTREEEMIVETRDVGGPPRMAISDACKAIYYRPVGPTRTLLGRGFPKEYEYVDPDRYKESADVEFIEDATHLFVERFPSFDKALLVNAYTGLYDVTPDWHPILGKVDGLNGFLMCAGFSGHGFKIGPSIGELMAEEVLDGGARSIDISGFSLSRFASGKLLRGTYGANRA